jgi:hypothetical protein
MEVTAGWTSNVFNGLEGSNIQDAIDKNMKIAYNRLFKVLLARWLIFRAFIGVAVDQNGGVLPGNIKRDWLLFQILPLEIDDDHPFVALIFNCLEGVSTGTLLHMLDEFKPSRVLGSAFNSKHDTFFYVLDEAQVAGQRFMGAFTDTDIVKPRPVLRPILMAWTESLGLTLKVIISGTGFSPDLFQVLFKSGLGGKQPEEWDVVHTMGDFTDRSIQKSYISRYLPAPFLLSPSGTALITRMFQWLRGR